MAGICAMQNIDIQRIMCHTGGAKSQGIDSTDLVHLKYLKMVYFAYIRERTNPDNRLIIRVIRYFALL